MTVNDILGFVEQEITRREQMGKLLAEKFPELRGLSYDEFLEKCPLVSDLDFITLYEMYKALQGEKQK